MKYVTCNLCSADNWVVRFPSTLAATDDLEVSAFACTSSGYGAHTQIVECFDCGYVYANPTWDENDLIEAYETVEDDTYVNERVGRELTFSKHLAKLEKFTGAANGRAMLDVGAYIGVFVEVANRSGWQASGVEPSKWAVEVAQSRGLDVVEGTLDSPHLHGKSFDAITLWDVIEHVDDPSAELKKSFDLLKPGGLIAVHTMDIDSLMAKVMRGRWPWLMAMHVHYFSQRTLTQMMQKHGFEIVWAGPEGRYLRAGYLATRLGGLIPALGKVAGFLVDRFHLGGAAIPINFGDLMTVYAIRPK